MRGQLIAALLLAVATVIQSLPVKEQAKAEPPKEEAAEEKSEDWELNLEYGRYLKEVVQALESDPAFRKKLETAEVDDIKSGKIARELHFVDHNVRTKLDELKRRELERLRHLAVKEHEKEMGVDRNLLKVPLHIDHRNPTRFEVEDLKKLIVKTTEDLEKVDNQRHDEFKNYEMEKEYDRQKKLAELSEDERKQEEVKHTEEVKKHKDHKTLHHPGSKQQLEEVWETQDHMKGEDFEPKTFFHLHDLDGNGFWDQMEVKSLFQKELDKMYDPNATEDDMHERYEEMERMREHVFKESDTNGDNLISFDEFMEQTKKTEFESDNGWQGLDEQEIYSQQEYEAYEHERQEEIRRLVESGAIPPPPGYHGSPPIHPAVYQGGPYVGHPADAVGLPPPHAVPVYGVQPQVHPQGHPNDVPQGYQAAPQVYQAVPQGYQAVPQGYQAVPQGYQAVPQGYQAVPQAVHPGQTPPQGHQAVHPSQVHPQGYQAVPAGQAIPQGYQQVPQGIAQGQGQAHVQYIPQESPYQVPAQPAGGQQQPSVGQPVAGQHVAGQPVVNQQPAVNQPGAGHPVANQQPIAVQPVVNQQPIAGQPVAGQPIAGQPVQAQAALNQHVPAQPIADQPVAAHQPLGQKVVNNIQSNTIH